MTMLERLEARAAIADLVHAYALAIRRDEPQDILGLFTPDGTFEVREGAPDRTRYQVQARFEDPGSLVAFLMSSKGQSRPIPLIHNLLIEVDGSVARASSVMVGPIPGTDRQVIGEYDDSFVKADDEWLFAARIYTLFRTPDPLRA